MITENLSTLKIHKLTQEQYNREYENGNLDGTALYLTPDTTDRQIAEKALEAKYYTDKQSNEHKNSEIAHNTVLERKHKSMSVNLPVNGWVDNKQTVEIEGLDNVSDVIVGASVASEKAYSEAGVLCTEQKEVSHSLHWSIKDLTRNGTFDTEESISDLSPASIVTHDSTSDRLDYVTATFDLDKWVRFRTEVEIELGKTYHFSAKFRVNEEASADIAYIRLWFNYVDETSRSIIVNYPDEQGCGTPSFLIYKKGSTDSRVDSEGWRTIEFDYEPTEEQLVDGNVLSVSLYRGMGDENIQPFDMKDFTLTCEGSDNLIPDADFSKGVDLNKKFYARGMTLYNGAIFATANFKPGNRGVVYTPHVYPEKGKTYQIDVTARLNKNTAANSLRISPILIQPYSSKDLRITKSDDYIKTVFKGILCNVDGYNPDYAPNATIYNHNYTNLGVKDDSYEIVSLDDENCIKVKYSTVAPARGYYHIRPDFTSGYTPFPTTNHKYIRFKYKTNSSEAAQLLLVSDSTGASCVLVENLIDTENEWILTPTIEITEQELIDRWANSSHNTISYMVSKEQTDIELYITDLVLFDSLEDANTYAEGTGDFRQDYFTVTKEWKTFSMQTTYTGDDAGSDYYQFKLSAFGGISWGDYMVDIDSISFKKMIPIGALTFKCEETPAENLTANVVILGG